MKHSSRRNPCPICGRDKDDKCRWNDEFILCYAGDSFSPPGYLKLGDKIKVGQERYALCSQVSGFAGNSYCFALIDDFDYRFLSYEDKITYRRQTVKITRIFLRRQAFAIALVGNIEAEDALYEMNSDQLYASKHNIKTAIPLLTQLIEYATLNKRYIVDYLQQIKQVIEAVKKAREALDCIHCFERDLLASPHPEQSDMRGGENSPEGGSRVSSAVLGITAIADGFQRLSAAPQ